MNGEVMDEMSIMLTMSQFLTLTVKKKQKWFIGIRIKFVSHSWIYTLSHIIISFLF